jgi:hypothetical protein
VRRLELYLPLAGALAAVCWVVATVLLEVGGNPAGPEDAETIATFFRDDRTAILAATTIHSLGAFFFLWFVAALRRALQTLPQAGGVLGTAAFAAGIAGAVLMAAMLGGHSTGATTDAGLLGPESSLAFWRLPHTFVVGAEVTLAVFVLALSVLALAGVLLPRWIGWAGIVVAVLLLIPPLGWIALLLLFPLWLAAVSVLLFAAGRAALVPAAGTPDTTLDR